jgi:hypothetical protein
VLLTGSEAVSSEGKIKKLFTGDKAPFNGALIDEEGLRQIDIDQLEKDSCEKRLIEMPTSNDITDLGIPQLIIGLVLGGLVGYSINH